VPHPFLILLGFYILYAFNYILPQGQQARVCQPHRRNWSDQTLIPFEQVLSNKLHISLVILSSVSRKQTFISRSSKSSTVISLSSSMLSDTESQFGALLHGIKAKASSLPASKCVESTIDLGKKDKKRILNNYQMQYASDYNDSIVMKKKVRLTIIVLLSIGLG
jgi:hypothetical protein